MGKPSRPFERYRTRSALFLMIYAVAALIAGIPNIIMVTSEDDRRILVILGTSILVVSRYVGYIKLAGFALLNTEHIRIFSPRMSVTIGVIIAVLIANAAVFLYRFGLTDISIVAVSAGCLMSAGVMLSHLVASRDRGLTRSRLMRMVSGVLIVLGCANICITRFYLISPAFGLITLFFGIYTERKTLSLAVRQTFAAAGAAAGAGISVYFLRWYLDPSLLRHSYLDPPLAIALGLALGAIGAAYYLYSRRVYASETLANPRKNRK